MLHERAHFNLAMTSIKYSQFLKIFGHLISKRYLIVFICISLIAPKAVYSLMFISHLWFFICELSNNVHGLSPVFHKSIMFLSIVVLHGRVITPLSCLLKTFSWFICILLLSYYLLKLLTCMWSYL